jgi:hypothetical protein
MRTAKTLEAERKKVHRVSVSMGKRKMSQVLGALGLWWGNLKERDPGVDGRMILR